MNVDKETEQEIQQLSMLEQNMQNTSVQKQRFQAQLMEIESAMEELEDTDEAFKIVANIMVKSDSNKLKTQLSEKKEVLELRINSLEKQESKLQEKAEELQKRVLGKIEK